MVIFFLPISINAAHDFLNHEHSICVSKIEKHIHEKEIDCNFHLIKQTDYLLVNNSFSLEENITISKQIDTQYYFLKKHLQLSFSLRGPPSQV